MVLTIKKVPDPPSTRPIPLVKIESQGFYLLKPHLLGVLIDAFKLPFLSLESILIGVGCSEDWFPQEESKKFF